MTGTSCKTLKRKLLMQASVDMQEKLNMLVEEMNHLGKAIEDDIKSSAGDKYETSREMVNSEREKLYLQIEESRKSLVLLNSLSLDRLKQVGLGSLVRTNKEWVYLAISLGQVKIDKDKVLVISPITPLGKVFMDKVVGDSIKFNHKIYKILGIC